MGTLNKPGAHNCLGKLQRHPNMPYFLLLASDPDAPKTVMDWAVRRGQRGDPNGKAAEAYEVAGAMEAWKAHHDSSPALVDETAGGWSIVPLLKGKSGAFLGGVAFTLGVFVLRAICQ